ncbi:MAG: C45 family peptidase [FCB group bacterium]|jgi:hypothetical protein|nr:C45 family peptidase [FCB group bacterium]
MKRIFFVLLAALVACAPAMAGGYRTSVGQGDDATPVVVVWGTPLEMGQAQGELLKDEINACVPGFLEKNRASGDARLTDETLDAAWNDVKPHTDKRVLQEMEGISKGSGVSFDALRRAYMVPVVGDYACSGVAVWGAATKDGHLYQLRNLDYSTDVGLQDYPVVVIYIPKEGQPHANVTFAGMAGCNTGMNAAGVVLGEKGATPGEDYPFNLKGEHFTTLFRSLLYDATSLDQAIDMLQKAPRIKKYYWYIGDGKIPAAVKIRAFAPNMDVWKGGDPTDEFAPNVIDNCIYCTMDDKIAYDTVKQNYGKLDAQSLIDLSRAVSGGDGNLLDAVYAPSTLEMWVAYAEKEKPAATREYVHLNMNDYLTPSKIPEGAKVFEPKGKGKKK